MGYGRVDRPTAIIIRMVFNFIGGHGRKNSPGTGSLYMQFSYYANLSA